MSRDPVPVQRRLTVCHVIEPLIGGAPKQVALSVALLDEKRFQVELIYPDGGADPLFQQLPPHIKKVRIPLVHEISPWRDARSFFILFVHFIRHRPDVVHAHSSKAGFIARWAAGLAGVPKIYYTPHGFSYLRTDISPFTRKIFRWLERACAFWTTGVVAVSKSEALEAEKVVPAHKIFVNPNGVMLPSPSDVTLTPALSPPRERVSEGRVRGAIVIGTSGRLTAAKGPAIFFDVAQNLVRKRSDVRFQWIGGEGEWQIPPDKADAVELTGWLAPAEALERLSEVDIFLMTSEWEGMPFALLEAMSLGKPAVVMNRYGMAELVRHGETGFTANTAEEIEGYLTKLIEDPALRIRFGVAARSLVRENFSAESMAKRLEAIYTGKAEVSGKSITPSPL